MDIRHLTAPCGLDCFNCPAFLARDNEKLRSFVALHFDVEPDQAWCPGCRELGGQIHLLKMDKPCRVWQCIEPKGLHNCSECEDFPCDNLHPVADMAAKRIHNAKVFNLCLIRKMGLEEWARDKAARVRQTYFRSPLEL